MTSSEARDVNLLHPQTASERDRFWAKVDRTGDCWLWTAGLVKGYGVFFRSHNERVAAHRYAYEDWVGPVPEGLELDHVCHTEDSSCRGGAGCLHRRCVRPDHLEPVTHAENVARGRRCGPTGKQPATHCRHGHEYTSENTYVTPPGYRSCFICRAASRRKYNSKFEGVALTPSRPIVLSEAQVCGYFNDCSWWRSLRALPT